MEHLNNVLTFLQKSDESPLESFIQLLEAVYTITNPKGHIIDIKGPLVYHPTIPCVPNIGIKNVYNDNELRVTFATKQGKVLPQVAMYRIHTERAITNDNVTCYISSLRKL